MAPEPAQRVDPGEHSSTHVAAHFPREQYGVSEGHGTVVVHDAHPSSPVTHVLMPSPAHVTSPAVHQLPQGRRVRRTGASTEPWRTGVTLDFPKATRFPLASPQTESSMGVPAKSSLKDTTTDVTDVRALGSEGTVEV